MGFVWIIGALIFYFRNERDKTPAPQLDRYPLFSILVPCHNEEKQIKDTILNLLKLDYPNYEIVAIDDGSPDTTAAILHALSVQHEQVRVVYIKENGGKGAALNTGCLVARGELLMAAERVVYELDPVRLAVVQALGTEARAELLRLGPDPAERDVLHWCVRWGLSGNIVAAWLLTFPVCFAISAVFALMFCWLFLLAVRRPKGVYSQ